MSRCNSVTCCSNVFPSLTDIVFTLSVKRIPKIILIQSIYNELTNALFRFQFWSHTTNSALLFVEKSIVNRAFFSKQVIKLVAVKLNVVLEKDSINFTIPTTRQTLLSDQVLEEIINIENVQFQDKPLQNNYFQRVFVLKQIGIITALFLPILYPKLTPDDTHFLVTSGDIFTLTNIGFNSEKY